VTLNPSTRAPVQGILYYKLLKLRQLVGDNAMTYGGVAGN
jgi:hypothetical protein